MRHGASRARSASIGAASGKPCGERVSKLEKDTVFVSAYERYGDNATWFEMLLHRGDVIETDVKSGGT